MRGGECVAGRVFARGSVGVVRAWGRRCISCVMVMGIKGGYKGERVKGAALWAGVRG